MPDQGQRLWRWRESGGWLDGRTVPVTVESGFESGTVGGVVDEKLRLPDGAGRAGKLAEYVVDLQALVNCERQAALLPVAVGGFGRPRLGG